MAETVAILGDRIVVAPIRNSEFSDGGIWTGEPTTTFAGRHGNHVGKTSQICMGVVVAVGSGKRHLKTGKRVPLDVRVGQYITFSDSCHRPVRINDQDLVYLREGDVMTIADEAPDHVSLIYKSSGTSIPALEKPSYG